MKHLFLIIALSFSLTSLGQFRHEPYKEWQFSVGVNTVVNLGERNPFFSPDKWAFKRPIAISAERGLSEYLGIDFNLSLNGFNKGDQIDGMTLPEDYNYLSADASLKYYFGRQLFTNYNASWFDLYALAGPGYFVIDESNLSLNLGGGVIFWLNDDQRLGIKLQSTAKFAIDAKEYLVDNNHFQYHLQMVFKL